MFGRVQVSEYPKVLSGSGDVQSGGAKVGKNSSPPRIPKGLDNCYHDISQGGTLVRQHGKFRARPSHTDLVYDQKGVFEVGEEDGLFNK